MRSWTIGLAMTIGVLATTSARAEPQETLEVRVLTVNHSGVRHYVLERAEQEASRIFSVIGIRLDWINVTPNDAGPHRQEAHHLKVRVIRDSPSNRSGRKLGIALRSEDNHYLVAYAFYYRIENLAEQVDIDPAPILGHVIAHEIGHLLLPRDSHASSGIMGAGWDRARLEGMGKGRLLFTAEQADLIRTRVRAMLAN